MQFTNLFKVEDKQIYELNFSDYTPRQLIESHTLQTTVYLTVISDEDVERTVNLSLLFTETVIGKLNTWNEIIDQLTSSMIESYSESRLNIKTPAKFVDHISVLNNTELDMHYTTIHSPDIRDTPSLLWKLPDLAISQTASTFDFSQCICSVNGLISKPMIFNDELFIPNGTKHLLNSNLNKHPDVVLLDFSKLADIEILPFSMSSHKVLKPIGGLNKYSDIELTFDNIDLTNKSVLVVIGYTLILHDKIKVINKNTIHVSPHLYPLHVNLLRSYQLSQQYVNNTDILRTRDDTVEEYLATTMFEQDHYGAFAIIVDTPSLLIAPMKVAPEVNTRLLRTTDELGILRRQSSWGIVDYVSDPYKKLKILYLNDPDHLFQLDTDPLKEQIGIEAFDCHHNKTISDYYDSGYEMFKLIS